MKKFRVSIDITVEIEAESEASALAGVVARQRELVLPTPPNQNLGATSHGWFQSARTRVTYIPKRGDIVTVTEFDRTWANDYKRQGIRYDIPYRVIKANNPNGHGVTHLQEVGGRNRVLAWNRNLRPVEAAVTGEEEEEEVAEQDFSDADMMIPQEEN